MIQIYNTITQTIKNNNKFLIMTHKNPDFDGMSSAIALHQIINSFKKECYICSKINEHDKSLKKAYRILEEENIKNIFLSEKESEKFIDEKTVLIILDTHKEKMVELPKLLKKSNNIIVVDHHIKSKDYIKNSIINYINSNLSSTVEFIVGYIKFLNRTVNPKIATFLLVGIEIDTNKYKLKTTEHTYESAAFLSKMGADNILKQEILKESMEEYLKKTKFIEKSYMVNDNMALCVIETEILQKQKLAQIAEELLQFENVEASFVVGKIGNNLVGISARSIGNVNVEKIMSILGGGGHINEAATQIESLSIKDVKDKLLEVIK